MTTKVVQLAAGTTLQGAGVVVGATTVTVSELFDVDGNSLTMTDFGTTGFGTFQPNVVGFEEGFQFTGITKNGDGTDTITGISHTLSKSPYTATAGVNIAHPGGSRIVLSNNPGLYNKQLFKDNDETVTGEYTFPAGGNANAPKSGSSYSAPTDNLEYASKKYVDDTAFAGANLAATIMPGTAGETLAAGQLVYFKESDQRWWKTDADAFATTAEVKLGIAQGAATAGVTVNINLGGYDTTVTGLTAGFSYFVSGTAGGFALSPGAIQKFVGWAVTSTSFIFQPDAIAENFVFDSAGETISPGQWVYFKTSDQKWWKTDADAAATANGVRIGVAQTTAIANSLMLVRIAGLDQTQTGLVAGSPYYLSGTLGAISATPGTFPQFVGRAISATEIMMNPIDYNAVHQWGQELYAASSAGTDTYAITLTPSPVSYYAGMVVRFKADVANTGAATLNVNGIGAAAIQLSGSTLPDNTIAANQFVTVIHDGTQWQMVSPPNPLIDGNTSNATDYHYHSTPLNDHNQRWVFVGSANDGLTTGGTGTEVINRFGILSWLATDVNTSDSANLRVNLTNTSAPVGLAWAKALEFQGRFKLGSTANQLSAMWIIEPGGTAIVSATETQRHFGFVIDGATLYATNASGTTQTRTDVSSGITLTNFNTYRAVFTPGVDVKFYINGTLVATQTTNLPSGTAAAATVFYITTGTSTTASKNMTVYNNYVIAETY